MFTAFKQFLHTVSCQQHLRTLKLQLTEKCAAHIVIKLTKLYNTYFWIAIHWSAINWGRQKGDHQQQFKQIRWHFWNSFVIRQSTGWGVVVFCCFLFKRCLVVPKVLKQLYVFGKFHNAVVLSCTFFPFSYLIYTVHMTFI